MICSLEKCRNFPKKTSIKCCLMNNEIEVEKEGYLISTNPSRIDVSVVHGYLSKESYWAKDIPLETVQKSIDNSLCFGLYFEGKQIGFARLITDKATFAYLADVF